MSRPDPNLCPQCERVGGLQVNQMRATWQPVTLDYTKDGTLDEVDYEAFDYGDDIDVMGYDCRECGAEWPDLDRLAWEQRYVHALRELVEHHNRRADRINALLAIGRWTGEEKWRQEEDHLARALAYEHAIEIFQGNEGEEQ